MHSIVQPLLHWYDRNARDLPWRRNPSPYATWISEIMLQQTRVEAGKAYFSRWMDQLPEIDALANVSDEKLMKLWEGLGYYSRARNLKKAAGIVMEQYGGKLPDQYDALLSLPGIGPYTAGAIGSIAFGLPLPAVDGNVLRVAARLTAWEGAIGASDTRKRFEKILSAIIPKGRPGDFNQALMELGALVCIPNGAPKCGECPLSQLCKARALGKETVLPVKVAKKARRVEKRTILILRCEGRVLLQKRKEKGLLAGLWELPAIEGDLDLVQVESLLSERGFTILRAEPLPEAKHIFSHIEWHMAGYVMDLGLRPESRKEPQPWITHSGFGENPSVNEEPEYFSRDREEEKLQWVWAGIRDLDSTYALPSAFAYYREFLPGGRNG